MFHNVEDIRNPEQTKKEHLNRWVMIFCFLSGEKEGEKRKKTSQHYTQLAIFASHGSIDAGTKKIEQGTMDDGICLPIPYPKIKVCNEKKLINPPGFLSQGAPHKLTPS